jgi:hypothetical protein
MTDGRPPNKKRIPSIARLRIAAVGSVDGVDARTHAAWRTWLAALAKDAEVATAAALAYESLDASGREAWLDAVDSDAPHVEAPKVALYAPLLAVEQDETRRSRILLHVTDAEKRSTPTRALAGATTTGRVCLIVSPLYLEFVEVLLCHYAEDRGIDDARHEWLLHERDVAPCAAAVGVPMHEIPLADLVEELAHALLADRRAGREAPCALTRYIDLFALDRSGFSSHTIRAASEPS